MRDTRELTDDQSARIAPHLPAQQPKTGRPAHDHCRIIEGLAHHLRTGTI